ncbi:hypothetical protein Nepgr_004254 [Nepenthes gracilis]|uniref:Uncharacterized protein n=1 Tax=Nepenthes gracilis TaxID=150966 RepID=A0AAD3XF00_NEPGR|nr:hypothetical protein Nepgr_004254 [Nepenthes gracilis]
MVLLLSDHCAQWILCSDSAKVSSLEIVSSVEDLGSEEEDDDPVGSASSYRCPGVSLPQVTEQWRSASANSRPV